MKKLKSKIYLYIFPASGSTDEGIARAYRNTFAGDVPKIARTERGKPYFSDRPDIHMSVSHSGKYFVCAFSTSPVGVDIQEHVLRKGENTESAAPRLKKIAARFFHPDEKEYIEKDTFERFYRVWTAKEAFVKYTGKGIDGDFPSLCAISADMPALDTRTPASWQTASACFLQIKPDDSYTLCICSPEEFEPIITCQ